MDVLVTGGAGFIGSHIVDRLIGDGHSVRILDSLEPQVHGKNGPPHRNESAELIVGDVRDSALVAKAIRGIDVIFHEAALVGVGQSMYRIPEYVDANVLGTARLLQALADGKHDVKKVILASSMSLYGEGSYLCEDCGTVYPHSRPPDRLANGLWGMVCPRCGKDVDMGPTAESKPLFPTSIYAMTKKSQEEMGLLIGKTYGIPTVALRYFNVYGPRQSLSNPYTGVCAIFSSRIKNDQPPVVFENGRQSRDFTSVHDVVEANMLAMGQSSANYETFNVGTGSPTSVLSIAHALAALYGKDLPPQVTNRYRKGDICHCYADISKIKSRLGYRPRVGLDKGLEELVRWGDQEEALDRFKESYDELSNKGLV